MLVKEVVSEGRQRGVAEEECLPSSGLAAEWKLEFDISQAGACVGRVGGVERQVDGVRGEEEANGVSFRSPGNSEGAVSDGYQGKELLGRRVCVYRAVDAPQ